MPLLRPCSALGVTLSLLSARTQGGCVVVGTGLLVSVIWPVLRSMYTGKSMNAPALVYRSILKLHPVCVELSGAVSPRFTRQRATPWFCPRIAADCALAVLLIAS